VHRSQSNATRLKLPSQSPQHYNSTMRGVWFLIKIKFMEQQSIALRDVLGKQ
jgi:hypothetical protein